MAGDESDESAQDRAKHGGDRADDRTNVVGTVLLRTQPTSGFLSFLFGPYCRALAVARLPNA
jgi:hypothetical protein